MKALCNYDGSYKSQIPDIKIYEQVKNGVADWKPHIKAKLKTVEIPFELFEYLMELDRKVSDNSGI